MVIIKDIISFTSLEYKSHHEKDKKLLHTKTDLEESKQFIKKLFVHLQGFHCKIKVLSLNMAFVPAILEEKYIIILLLLSQTFF